jgi:hypothetical protein
MKNFILFATFVLFIYGCKSNDVKIHSDVRNIPTINKTVIDSTSTLPNPNIVITKPIRKAVNNHINKLKHDSLNMDSPIPIIIDTPFDEFEKIRFNSSLNDDSLYTEQLYPSTQRGFDINNLIPPFYIYDYDSTKIYVYKKYTTYNLVILSDTTNCVFCNPYLDALRYDYLSSRLDTVLTVFNISLNNNQDQFMFHNEKNSNRWLYGWFNAYLPNEFDFKIKYNISVFPLTLLLDAERRIICVNPTIEQLHEILLDKI